MPTRNEHHNGDHGKIQKHEDGLAPSMLPKASVPSELGSKDQSLASRLSRSGTRSARRIAAVLRSPSSKRLTPRRLRQLGVVSVASIRVRCRIGSANHLLHMRSEEHTSELQSRLHLVCRLLLEKKKI